MHGGVQLAQDIDQTERQVGHFERGFLIDDD